MQYSGHAPRIVIEESIVQQRSVRDNFTELAIVEAKGNVRVVSAVERSVGLLVSLKILGGADLKRIAHEMLGHQRLPNHHSLLHMYRGAVEPNRSFVIIREYYQ